MSILYFYKKKLKKKTNIKKLNIKNIFIFIKKVSVYALNNQIF